MNWDTISPACITAWSHAAVFSAGADAFHGHTGRVYSHPFGDLQQARAVRHRGGGAAGGIRVPDPGAGRRAGIFEGDSRHQSSGDDPAGHAGAANGCCSADFPRRSGRRHLSSSGGAGGLGGDVRDRAQSSAGRPTGWRPRRLRAAGPVAQVDHADFPSGAAADGQVVERLVALGGGAVLFRAQASAGLRPDARSEISA